MNARIVKAAAGLALFVLGALFPAMADAQTDIYILAGQSNMVGVPPGQTPTQNPTQLFMFNANGQFEQAKDPLDSLAPGQNPVGVGQGLAFADKMATYFPGTQIGLVQCAYGGSSMTQWVPSYAKVDLYGSMLMRARQASPQFGTIKGLLWYQGESESWDRNNVSVW